MKLKTSIKVVMLLLFSASFLTAQTKKVDNSFSITTENPKAIKPVPIDTHPVLIKIEEEMAALVKANPEMLKTNRLNKTTSVSYSVGDSKDFWTVDFENSTSTNYVFYKTSSTCRSVGTYCDVFVEDSVWNVHVDQDAVDEIAEAFDNSTPANSEEGIYETVTGVFGDCPDVDSDGKIIILVLNIKDGYTASSGSYTAGYFYSVNEYSQEDLGSSYKTNEAEIFYMDCNPATLTTESGLEEVLGTTAHEFQHMVHWTYHQGTTAKPSQPTFFNEGCSQLAPYLCGYGLPDVERYLNLNSTNNCALTDWNSNDGTAVLIDYSRCTLYFLYLYEQFGVDFIGDFVQSSDVGSTAITSVLSDMGESRDYQDVFEDWVVANALNDKSLNEKWGYDYDDEELPLAKGDVEYMVSLDASYDVYSYAAQYITYVNGEDLYATLSASSSLFSFKAIEISGTDGVSSAVTDISNGATFYESNFSNYDQIKIVAFSTDTTSTTGSTKSFSISSTGNSAALDIELAYDTSYTNSHIYDFPSGTKQAVAFDGVNGGTLSSIKALFYNTEPMTVNIYSYTGTITAPTGTSLVDQFTITPDTEKSWFEYSLEDKNIDVSDDFLVVFDISQSPSEDGNAIGIALKPGTSFANSIFYVPSYSSWLYYTASGSDSTLLNRIRAYVSVPSVTGVEDEVEATPTEFTLAQNYPNPFNPTTTISYSLPEAADVQLKIYDIMGREIKSLLNEEKAAGSYEIQWDGTNMSGQKVASGIYFYRVQAGSFIATKKMIMLK